MQYKNIMVPLDGSEPSLRALQTAVELARDSSDTQIHGVRLIPAMDMSMQPDLGIDPFGNASYPEMIDPAAYREVVDASLERAKRELVEQSAETIAGMEDRVSIDVIMAGSISTGIIEYAEENGCDFIVMGSRGLGKIRSILGSVSYSVLQASDIPVTIVK